MGPLIEDNRFTDADAALIRRKATRLVGQYGYRRQDVPDLEQELALHVVLRSSQYDPARGSRDAFVTTVAKHKLLNLIAARMAAKRGGRNFRLGAVNEPRAEHDVALTLDVRDVLARLPEDVRRVVELRPAGHTVAEAGRRLGLSRYRVRQSLEQARLALERANLQPFQINSKSVNHSAGHPGR